MGKENKLFKIPLEKQKSREHKSVIISFLMIFIIISFVLEYHACFDISWGWDKNEA